MTTLLLIRHAMTDWAGRRLAGWLPDVHLNAEGRRQAEELAARLAGVALAAIYSSPLERALETARVLAAGRSLPVQLRLGLGELRCGDWQGKELEELSKDPLWPAVQFYPSGVRFPGGEALRETQARMVATLSEIVEAHAGQVVAAVSHADPIALAVAHYAGVHMDLFQRLVISPASVTVITFGPLGPRLLRLNDAGALRLTPEGGAAGPPAAEARRASNG